MSYKIKDSAVQYQAVYNLFKEITNPANPLSVSEAYEMLGDKVKNETQVRDAIRKYNSIKALIRVKEGGSVKYWYHKEPDNKLGFKQAILPTKSSKEIDTVSNQSIKPEITVEKHRIVINHNLCKIIIELK